MNTSVPRMFSSIWNETSVSGKRRSRACLTRRRGNRQSRAPAPGARCPKNLQFAEAGRHPPVPMRGARLLWRLRQRRTDPAGGLPRVALGRQVLSLRRREPKSRALPLGHAPSSSRHVQATRPHPEVDGSALQEPPNHGRAKPPILRDLPPTRQVPRPLSNPLRRHHRGKSRCFGARRMVAGLHNRPIRALQLRRCPAGVRRVSKRPNTADPLPLMRATVAPRRSKRSRIRRISGCRASTTRSKSLPNPSPDRCAASASRSA